MNDTIVVDLFVEDHAHEALLTPLVARVARDVGIAARIRVRSARGGRSRALGEFKRYQRAGRSLDASRADLLIVAIDGNCSSWATVRKEIEKVADDSRGERLVAACPDPHIERWFLADPESFHKIVGSRPQVGKEKCERGHYKRMLVDAVRSGGHPPTLGGVEFAPDLAGAMDLYRAGKEDRSLKAFLDDLRSSLQSGKPS